MVPHVTPEALQSVALAMAQERAVETVLARIVGGLVDQPGVALARVWLIAPGDICQSCPMRPECPDQTRCLHLAASAGRPTDSAAEPWTRLDGAFRRFPLNVRKIGHIGGTGSPVFLQDLAQESDWIVRPDWAQRERIQSFAGQPLSFRGEVLGVLAVFSRTRLDAAAFGWLRSFADHAAVAIANSCAFAEIERLREQLERENVYLREEVKGTLRFGEIVGESGALQKVLEQVELVAPTDAGVLILGESGTGKELVALAIHERSRRRTRPLIRVNCAAVPRELFESEFFGHVKGAFTGALKDRPGRFQLADGGTLFLDEVGEIPLELQSKLLRVIQEGQFERVGDDDTRRADVRVIAATNRDLKYEVDAARFREDLYYRLSLFPIEVPPLRARLEDVPPLAAHFAAVACRRLGYPAVRLTRRDVHALQRYDWPGNVRELQNVIERAIILSRGGPLRLDVARAENTPRRPGPRTLSGPAPASSPPVGIVPAEEWKRRERENVLAALSRADWKIYGPRGAAGLLGLKPTTLISRMKAMGIRRPPVGG